MHARGGDVEKPLHVRLRWRAAVHETVLKDVGKELALPLRRRPRFHFVFLHSFGSLLFAPDAGEGGLDLLLEAGDQFAVGGDQRLLGFDLGDDGLLRGEGWEGNCDSFQNLER